MGNDLKTNRNSELEDKKEGDPHSRYVNPRSTFNNVGLKTMFLLLATEVATIEKKKCIGITHKGTNCSFLAKYGDFCGIHNKYISENFDKNICKFIDCETGIKCTNKVTIGCSCDEHKDNKNLQMEDLNNISDRNSSSSDKKICIFIKNMTKTRCKNKANMGDYCSFHVAQSKVVTGSNSLDNVKILDKCHHSNRLVKGCDFCFSRSFAGTCKRISNWDFLLNTIDPETVCAQSHFECYFKCSECNHGFVARLSHISTGRWCTFCGNKQLCKNDDCSICLNKSFASDQHAKLWDYNNNGELKPRNIFKKSTILYNFICPVCKHSFKKQPHQFVKQTLGCEYCYGKLCNDDNCDRCFKKSVASTPRAKNWDYVKNGNMTPRQASLTSSQCYYFICPDCTHSLYVSGQLCNKSKCRFCSGGNCGDTSCSICPRTCDGCRTRRARKVTFKKKLQLCVSCFVRCIKADPEEIPLEIRAKISLEIYTLAELQRISVENGAFLLYEPTSWDCATLPDLPYRPDTMWCYDSEGNIFVTAGACKLNKNFISYVLILEILEGSIKQHNDSRSISVFKREQDIREMFVPIPVGFVNVTIAHDLHRKTNPEDVFFTKADGLEYKIISGREKAWQARVCEIRDTLMDFYTYKKNETKFIGH